MKVWAVYHLLGGRWREAHHGLEFLDACGLANWYQSIYGGEWCANSDRRRLGGAAIKPDAAGSG